LTDLYDRLYHSRVTMTETTEAQLRRHIVERGLRPGDRLPSESELAARIGVSRLLVREALRSLEALGVVEPRAGSGWFVRRFEVTTAADTLARTLAFHPNLPLDLLAIRRSMEADLVADLAGKLSEPDLAALDELSDRMRWRAMRGQRFREEDAAYHQRLMLASGNQIAMALMDLFFRVMAALYDVGLPGPAPEDAVAVAEAHVRLVGALRRGDRQAVFDDLRGGHHSEARRRFSAWAEMHSASPGAGTADDNAARASELARRLSGDGEAAVDGKGGVAGSTSGVALTTAAMEAAFSAALLWQEQR
jgi:DNA-binding FadR family transcriptional regulator